MSRILPTRGMFVVLTSLSVSLACNTTESRGPTQLETQRTARSARSCCGGSGSYTEAGGDTPATETAGYQTATEWLDPDERLPLRTLDVAVTDQQGNALTLRNLTGVPVAMSFIYTRCENRNKCPKTTRTMAQLKRDVDAAGLQDAVYLALMTYDPEFDTSSVLYDYAGKYGIDCDGHMLMLRPDPQRKREPFDELDMAVSYSRRDVSVHGIQLILLDKQGRYVRTYRTLIWDNAKVIEDLKRLAAET